MTPLAIRAHRITAPFSFIAQFSFALFATFCSISLSLAQRPESNRTLRRASNTLSLSGEGRARGQ
jgi:hypothetical protein